MRCWKAQIQAGSRHHVHQGEASRNEIPWAAFHRKYLRHAASGVGLAFHENIRKKLCRELIVAAEKVADEGKAEARRNAAAVVGAGSQRAARPPSLDVENDAVEFPESREDPGVKNVAEFAPDQVLVLLEP